MGDVDRRHHVGQAVGAEQQGAIVFNGHFTYIYETFGVFVACRAADFPKYFVAPRMLHGIQLGQLAGVLALADRGMVVRELDHGRRAKSCRRGCRRRVRA